jgi:pimeloyl-ACP methyl ester carboxylesterase
VIEPGAGEPSRYWWPVADQIAEFARVCTYDRAGFGWSDPAAEPRTIEERARDLHGLLTTAGVPGPYVLVAHSYGGFIVRQFARMYPSETAGVVLVDTPEEATIFRPDVLSFYARMQLVLEAAQWAARCGILRLLSRWIALDAIGFPFIRAREYAAAIDDLESLQQVAPAMRGPGGFGTLGDVPLVVLSHGRPFPGPFAILEAGWHDGQVRLAALSQRGELIVAEKSNHLIQLDEPQLVVDAVRRVHALAIGQGGARKERFVI